MKLSTPRWWYSRDGKTGAIARLVLRPISLVWAAVTARRIANGRPVDPGVPVICVGNLTMGGTGKTPVVREIAQRLGGVVLSRGYGGSLIGPIQVDPARHTAAEVGDEPLMLARDLTVWVARDRAAGAVAAAKSGAKLIVMDDGHQNPSVKKTLSLVVIDGETRGDEWPFGDGRVFPAGPMREPLLTGLARADAAIILLPADVAEPNPFLMLQLMPAAVVTAHLAATVPPPPGPQIGFAGVGKPWKVERSLQVAGCDLKDFWPFPDHHAYDEATLQRLADRAAQFGAGLVTTEKDWARLPAAWRDRVVAWPVRAVFDHEASMDALFRPITG
ncbi:MAG: tetraacyldisaccharide 4'-kinase [Alphaproteobacteria bacterium]|nr:tetraacyldisaccharide 4'-kinase [Alphaproteobacteria bacterium]MBU1514460.1 tetraacyldisaccharide 4'-kinase [Alphaproteobacteria bacterium]MBU2096908.1 tetraacyldisaccharide 4'-kinase [Alphaproteobacteria bacterium]MBU2305960.1 tetraacyldisaccharide 4'-kinase [Alphaproteobacteria bacterium]MBU2361902.1 tetraacyldisaccharide 4'-kinase [Alphaproteobacteria bacterium]